jgi:hypothetical protein
MVHLQIATPQRQLRLQQHLYTAECSPQQQRQQRRDDQQDQQQQGQGSAEA